MAGKSAIMWSMRELVEVLRARQLNKFDVNIGVSGSRGNGKSTFLFKIFHAFKKDGFRQRKHQVYSQNDVIKLLSEQKFGFCWDDEAINSGYKRDFQKAGQNELIKIVTNYRDNFNIYGSALPFFYSLDKALRELIFMHVHIIERGLGVIFLPLEGQIHTQDPWDAVTNKKIEAKENARLERNPESKFRYHKFTTFAGYVYFTKMTPKQQLRYDKIKSLKRSEAFKTTIENVQKSFDEKLFNLLKKGQLSKQGLIDACLLEDKKYTNVTDMLNRRLRDEGEGLTVSQLLKSIKSEENSNSNALINNLVPEIKE